MINYEYESLFRQDSIKKQIIITDNDTISLSNADIYSESLSLEESLCSEENLIFGSCEAACLKFTTSDVTDLFKGKKLNVLIVLADHTDTPFSLGSYTVIEETLTADRSKKEIKAYDDIYVIHETNVADWYNSLQFPITLKVFRNSFFNYLNINTETVDLTNDDMLVEKTIDVSVLSGTDVIKAICEINGVFGHIDRSGIFRFISLSSTSVYDILTSMYKKIEYEDYSCQPITQLQIREEENDIGVIVGSNGNSYIVEDNFLVYGKNTSDLTAIATNLLAQISQLTYIPCKVNCIGNPCVEVGDRFTVTKRDTTTFESFLLERTLKGIQALADSITSSGEEYYSEEVNGVQYDIRQLKGKSNVLERTIEETQSTIRDVERGLSTQITQTAEGLELQIVDLQSQIDGETAYYERESGEPTLLNYPYWDFTTSIPCNNTIRLDEIYLDNMGEGGDQYPHFTYTEQNRKDHRSDLCYVDDTNLGYRFVLENGVWYWKEIADSDFTQILSRLATLEATAEELTSEYSELSITLSDGYYTKVQTDSRISQSASQIQTTVAATYATKTTTTSLQSQITQTAASITSEVTRATTAEGNLSSRITQTATGLSSEVTRATTAEGNLSSRITQNANAITAKVSSSGGSSSSFAWELNTTNFRLLSNNTEVMKCNSSGLYVTGNIVGSNISGGTITGVEIRGSVTMANNSKFTTLIADRATFSTQVNLPSLSGTKIGGSNVSSTNGTSFYAPSIYAPSMVYSSELRGYVPVWSTSASWTQLKAPTATDYNRFMMTSAVG